MRRWLLIILALLLQPLLSGAAQAKVYEPFTATLANGLQIIVVPNHRAPVVHQMLWYKVGALDEDEGQSGLAHYLEHLMFKGTPAVPAGAFSKQIAAAGGHDNAFTSRDYTGYFATVPAGFLPQLMRLEADRMQNLLLTPELALPERDVVLAERRQRTDDDPHGRFAEKMNKAVYGAHPYGRPVIGWRAEVEQMTADTATAFYKKWYAPNNAVLIISGDVTAERAMELATTHFGALPRRDLPERAATRKLYRRHDKPQTVLSPDPDIRQSRLQRTYQAPTYHAGQTAYALEVLEEILDGGTVGRLYRDLVMRQGLATGASASYDGDARDLGSFTFSLTLRPGGNIGKTKDALDALLKKVARQGVTQKEVTLAIQRLQRQAIFTRDYLVTPGYAFGQALMAGLTVEDVENWPERIGAVTVDDVNAAARALFASQDYVTGYLVPQGHKPDAGPEPAVPEAKEIR